MGKILFGLLVFGSLSANAAWYETVGCAIERYNVDTGVVVTESISASMKVSGPHNGEKGKVTLKSQLAISYPIIYQKQYTGRNVIAKLTSTLYGNPIAMSSVDLANNIYVLNRYITAGGNYEITVGCLTE